jgi:hypothetical protein
MSRRSEHSSCSLRVAGEQDFFPNRWERLLHSSDTVKHAIRARSDGHLRVWPRRTETLVISRDDSHTAREPSV